MSVYECRLDLPGVRFVRYLDASSAEVAAARFKLDVALVHLPAGPIRVQARDGEVVRFDWELTRGAETQQVR